MIEENGRFMTPVTRKLAGYSEEGMLIDGKVLIQKAIGRHAFVDDRDLREYGIVDDGAPIRERLAKIARYLDEGRIPEAIFLANLMERTRDATNRSDEVEKANFNPNEPRSHGRWTVGSDGDTSAHLDEVQYRGRYHDFVLDDLLKGLAGIGSKVLKNVPVFGLDGVLAIPDGASKPQEGAPYFIEMKTGFDPKFTKNQLHVYALICAGGHAFSLDPRIRDLGLVPGVPFPPMQIMIVHTYGPELPMSYHDYCKDFLE